MKEGDGDIFENFEVNKMFIYLTCGKEWDVAKSQTAYSGSYTGFQTWRVDDIWILFTLKYT